MRAFEELLPRVILPQVPPDPASRPPPLISPGYLPMEEYNRRWTTTFLALGVVLCTVLVLSLMICCAARLAGRIHEHRRVRMRDRQRLTLGKRRMTRRLEVLRREEGPGQESGIRVGTATAAAEEEGKGGKKDNEDDGDGCDDEKRPGEDLEKEGEGEKEEEEEEEEEERGGGGGGGRWSEWDVGGDEELPEYDAVGFNERGEVIDAPCPAYLPSVRSVANVSNDGYGGMLVKEVLVKKFLWKWCKGRRG